MTVLQFPDRISAREPFLTKATLARRLHVSPKTLERWQKAGCPSQMLGGRRVFRWSEVKLWREEGAA